MRAFWHGLIKPPVRGETAVIMALYLSGFAPIAAFLTEFTLPAQESAWLVKKTISHLELV